MYSSTNPTMVVLKIVIGEILVDAFRCCEPVRDPAFFSYLLLVISPTLTFPYISQTALMMSPEPPGAIPYTLTFTTPPDPTVSILPNCMALQNMTMLIVPTTPTVDIITIIHAKM